MRSGILIVGAVVLTIILVAAGLLRMVQQSRLAYIAGTPTTMPCTVVAQTMGVGPKIILSSSHVVYGQVCKRCLAVREFQPRVAYLMPRPADADGSWHTPVAPLPPQLTAPQFIAPYLYSVSPPPTALTALWSSAPPSPPPQA